jgi:hypothetical protein
MEATTIQWNRWKFWRRNWADTKIAIEQTGIGIRTKPMDPHPLEIIIRIIIIPTDPMILVNWR